jgi:hypothetical protein
MKSPTVERLFNLISPEICKEVDDKVEQYFKTKSKTMFYPGQRVICVNDDFGLVINALMKAAQGLTLRFPEKDKKYTIREIFDNEGIVVSVTLEEIQNPSFQIPVINTRRELAFKADRFAPVNPALEESEELEVSLDNLVLN